MRKVDWQGAPYPLPELAEELARRQQFARAGSVTIRGKSGTRRVAQADLFLSRPAHKRTAHGRLQVRQEPLPLQLVISRVVDAAGKLLAEWSLLTNVPHAVSPATIADWYYWRWKIESYHKLLKSGGQQLESWQQESAEAITSVPVRRDSGRDVSIPMAGSGPAGLTVYEHIHPNIKR